MRFVRLCLWLLVLPVMGAYLDSGGWGGVAFAQTPACDRECHEKVGFYAHHNSVCYQFTYKTCLGCGAGASGGGAFNMLCSPSPNGIGSACISTEAQNMIHYYDSCDWVCQGSAAVREANMNGVGANPIGINKYICWWPEA